MRKEYFLTAPLLESPAPIQAGGCVIHLRGQQGCSFIEGPTQAAIDAARDDFVCVVAKVVTSVRVSFRIVLRSATPPSAIAFDSKSPIPQNWTAWAFSRIALSDMPVLILDEAESERLQRAF